MAELTDRQRRRELMFADVLSELADITADSETRRGINSLVQSIRRRCGYTREQKKEWILRCIADGAATVSDLVDETNFRRDDIVELAKELQLEGKIRISQQQAPLGGRPAILMFPL